MKLNVYEEASRCLLCQDAPCTKACKTGDPARAIRAVRFDNSKLGDAFMKPSTINRDTIVYPKFNKELCVGCGRCQISCSDGGHQAIVFDKETRRPQLIGSKCVGCHLCRLVCPAGAIGVSKRVPKKD